MGKTARISNEHKDLLILFADPKDDAVSVSFGGLNGFVRFLNQNQWIKA